eukprot:4831135-Prymnesium_polylepis.2
MGRGGVLGAAAEGEGRAARVRSVARAPHLAWVAAWSARGSCSRRVYSARRSTDTNSVSSDVRRIIKSIAARCS